MVPPRLELASGSALSIPVGRQALYAGASAAFTLRNPLGFDLPFQWYQDPGRADAPEYAIAPAQGVVRAHGTLHGIVSLQPSFQAAESATFFLHTDSNSELDQVALTCTGRFSGAKCAANPRRLLYGPINNRCTTTKHVILQNTGGVDAHIAVDLTPAAAHLQLQVSPAVGAVPAHGTLALAVSSTPQVEGKKKKEKRERERERENDQTAGKHAENETKIQGQCLTCSLVFLSGGGQV